MDNLPWIEKYRPHNLNDLMGQDNIINTIKKFIENDNIPHMLFYGIPGIGKTSCALAIAKLLYNEQDIVHSVLELNASDQRGIEFVRNNIKNFAETRMVFSSNQIKLIILDEVDNMTKDAQFALRGIIEKYSENVRFCLICNYVSKLIPAIQSRCTRFRFVPIKKELILDRIKNIIKLENINITDDAINVLINVGNGDMRKILNTLQSASLSFKEIITSDNIYSCVGKPTNSDINKLIESINNYSLDKTINLIEKQIESGLDISDILTEIFNYVKNSENEERKIYKLKELAEMEKRLVDDCSTDLQIYGLVSIFY